MCLFRGGREESRPYNTQVISALSNGHITAIFIESAAIPGMIGSRYVRTGGERRCIAFGCGYGCFCCLSFWNFCGFCGFNGFGFGGFFGFFAAGGCCAGDGCTAYGTVEVGKQTVENYFRFSTKTGYLTLGSEVAAHGGDDLLEGEGVYFASCHGVDAV